MPVLSNAVEARIDEQGLTVRRDMEDGFQTVRAPLPAMLLASTGLDVPRLPSLKGIMAAKKKPVDNVAVSVAAQDRLAWSTSFVPPKVIRGTIVQDTPPAEAATQLVAWLQEQKLI
jgi:electron transfer flavoprotein beta subunit